MKLENITNPEKRYYDDACGTAHALELIGERWALLVMRELMLGPRRFGELRADLPGISANVLTQRLAGLEASGLAVRTRLPPPASVPVYALTEWGLEAEPLICGLGGWAARSPLHDPTLPLSPVSLILSLRTMFSPERAKGLDARIALLVRGESFAVRIAGGCLNAGRGAFKEAHLTIEGGARSIAAMIYGGKVWEELEAAGTIRVTGDHVLAARFLTLFALPPKAEIAAATDFAAGGVSR